MLPPILIAVAAFAIAFPAGAESTRVLDGHSGAVLAVAFSPDGSRLASAGRDLAVRIWDPATGALRRTLEGHSSWVQTVAFSPDGRTLASGGGWDDTIALWNVASGERKAVIEGHAFGAFSVAFSPDGRLLASAGRDKTVNLWTADKRKRFQELEGSAGTVLALAFSPDGRLLATGNWNNTVTLWDLDAGREISVLTGHDRRVSAVAFSPDGKSIASASWDRTVRLWDVAGGKEMKSFAHADAVNAIAFSPDGQGIASAGADGAVRLWDVAAGNQVRVLARHTGAATSVSFSPDGASTASGGNDGMVRLWNSRDFEAKVAAGDGEARSGEQARFENVDFGTYHALVIGNNAHQYLPDLVSAVYDATEIARILADRYGFDVRLMINATRRDILLALFEMRRTLSENDNLLVYYAGHGNLDEATSRGYWLPVDAERDTPVDWISNAELTDALKAMDAWHVIVVADSCYSGTLLRSGTEPLSGGGDRTKLIERLALKKSRTVLSSGGLEPVVDGGGGGHSVFAKAFIEVLRENADVLEGQRLFTDLRNKVIANADQTPEYANIRLAGHDGGDFLFVPVK